VVNVPVELQVCDPTIEPVLKLCNVVAPSSVTVHPETDPETTQSTEKYCKPVTAKAPNDPLPAVCAGQAKPI
jgi:hypothetical protein